MMKAATALLIAGLAFCGNANGQAPAGLPPQGGNAPGAQPNVIVYKTKGAYANLVPVVLSPDKSRIVSYPAPADVRPGGRYAKPVVLHKGYLLDRRGINSGVAFLNLTYAQYAALPEAPSPDKMMTMLRDKDPLVRMCDCGLRSDVVPGQSNPTTAALKKQLNRWIDRKMLGQQCTESVAQ